MAGDTDYRVSAADSSSRPTPMSNRNSRRKKEPSGKKKHSTSEAEAEAEADEHTDSATEGAETKNDSDHLVDYYA